MPFVEVAAFGAALLSTAAVTAIVRRRALAHGRLDVPNARSSHSVPTPRGGGLAIVAVVLVATVIVAALAGLPVSACAALVIGGGSVALVGHWDDLKGLPILPRLAGLGSTPEPVSCSNPCHPIPFPVPRRPSVPMSS